MKHSPTLFSKPLSFSNMRNIFVCIIYSLFVIKANIFDWTSRQFSAQQKRRRNTYFLFIAWFIFNACVKCCDEQRPLLNDFEVKPEAIVSLALGTIHNTTQKNKLLRPCPYPNNSVIEVQSINQGSHL